MSDKVEALFDSFVHFGVPELGRNLIDDYTFSDDREAIILSFRHKHLTEFSILAGTRQPTSTEEYKRSMKVFQYYIANELLDKHAIRAAIECQEANDRRAKLREEQYNIFRKLQSLL